MEAPNCGSWIAWIGNVKNRDLDALELVGATMTIWIIESSLGSLVRDMITHAHTKETAKRMVARIAVKLDVDALQKGYFSPAAAPKEVCDANDGLLNKNFVVVLIKGGKILEEQMLLILFDPFFVLSAAPRLEM